MSSLVTSDTHFTDRPQDEYRWGLLDWLRQQAEAEEVDEIIHCGDLTDAKDRHNAKLVNRLVDEVTALSERARVILLRGNHDYSADPEHPFFQFTAYLDNVTYVATTRVLKLSIGRSLFVPAGAEWDGTVNVDVPYLFTHATFDGSEAENGRLLPGIDPRRVENTFNGKCYSGDIHVPQRIGRCVEYVGAPYHIRFGDRFTPRVLLIGNSGKTKDLHYPAPRKHVLDIDRSEELSREKIPPGDQVKVRCYLRRADYVKWRDIRQEIRDAAEAKGWHLFGPELVPLAAREQKSQPAQEAMSPKQLLEAYAKKQRAGDLYVETGRALLEEQARIR
jgi:hypothetical protein